MPLLAQRNDSPEPTFEPMRASLLVHKKITLYIERDAFILVSDDDILEIQLEGCKPFKRAKYEPTREARLYEICGVIGILKGFTSNYLVVISSCKHRGNISKKPVYVISKISCLELNYHNACRTLNQQQRKSFVESDGEGEGDNDSDSLDDNSANTDERSRSNSSLTTITPPEPADNAPSPRSSLIQQVNLSKFYAPQTSLVSSPSPKTSNSFLTKMKVSMGAKNPKVTEEPATIEDIDFVDSESVPVAAINSPKSTASVSSSARKFSLFGNVEKEAAAGADGTAGAAKAATAQMILEERALDQRMVRELNSLFSGDMFFFSYDLDLTNTFQRKYDNGTEVEKKPLWQQVDKRFFWNEKLAEDFIRLELHEWILPVSQGSLQIETCEIEGYTFDFILISRRSRERAGLRYQRRGLNEHGHVANFVETEQIISFERADATHYASFVQTRGSIPVFWSQSPYNLHPIPTLERSDAENEIAFEKHFADQVARYGHQIAVNLTELHGREGIITAEYRNRVENLAETDIKYLEFDFHRETRGMKYENISKLIKNLLRDFDQTLYFWLATPNQEYCRQNGTFRTNCMDCLDRTNVVQSAFGRHVLNQQLMRFGISEFPDRGIRYYEHFETIFNHAWANNGDMISREYAGTSALKGDFTRTGKRNITGMVNDASNSLARMYQNTVRDFWRQATIDYILGYHKLEIFRVVPQSTLMSAEPGVEIRWQKVRANAIDISSGIVISDGEEKIDGWTLLSPVEPNTKRGKVFEEKVFLLTKKAIYICSFHYSLEKVVQFKRIGLQTITRIEKGEYILSTSDSISVSPENNYGFLIYYDAQGESMRINSMSLRNSRLSDFSISAAQERDAAAAAEAENGLKAEEAVKDTTFMAFKAVRYNILGELPEEEVRNCREQVEDIVDKVAKACKAGREHLPKEGFVVNKPVISVEEAKKSTRLMTKVGKTLKKIWI